jgi:flavin-dependent dehydrogenase
VTTINKFDVIIAGAGPAGSSAAIHLAAHGLSVLLVDQKKFPRPKLCGEFISPECWQHFSRLGVADRMIASGGSTLKQTIFYSRAGNSVRVPSEWIGGNAALGLSRAEMDNNLVERARECGVSVLEEARVAGLLESNNTVQGISVKTSNSEHEYFAPVTIDATGRSRALSRHLNSFKARQGNQRRRLVAFKAHLRNNKADTTTCEIYSYPGGYGGLNAVEAGVSNLCFIVSARDVRRYNSDPKELMRYVVSKNRRAAHSLEGSEVVTPWLSVSIESFGKQALVPADGLLNIGDAAAFIDPFTGSGMLMALENGELVAETICRSRQQLEPESFATLASDYRQCYAERFETRLRVSKWLRRAAFVPLFAEAVIFIVGNDRVRKWLTRATRGASLRPEDIHPIES